MIHKWLLCPNMAENLKATGQKASDYWLIEPFVRSATDLRRTCRHCGVWQCLHFLHTKMFSIVSPRTTGTARFSPLHYLLTGSDCGLFFCNGASVHAFGPMPFKPVWLEGHRQRVRTSVHFAAALACPADGALFASSAGLSLGCAHGRSGGRFLPVFLVLHCLCLRLHCGGERFGRCGSVQELCCVLWLPGQCVSRPRISICVTPVRHPTA